MNKKEGYNKLIQILSSQIGTLQELSNDDITISQVEMRQEILKSFENHLKECS